MYTYKCSYPPELHADIGMYAAHFGEEYDEKVQLYLRKVREGGGIVSARIAIAAARGILLTYDKSKLIEYGGHVDLSRQWAYLLLRRMNFVQRKVTTAKSKMSPTSFAKLKKEFLKDVVSTVHMEEIPPELILNWVENCSSIFLVNE